jgi:hypothetical protein
MSGTSVVRGNLRGWNIYQLTLSPVSVAANTTAEQTFTLNGINLNDWVDVQLIGPAQAGVSLSSARVSAANTLALTFANVTGSPIVPTASSSYLIVHGVSEYNPLQTQP